MTGRYTVLSPDCGRAHSVDSLASLIWPALGTAQRQQQIRPNVMARRWLHTRSFIMTISAGPRLGFKWFA